VLCDRRRGVVVVSVEKAVSGGVDGGCYSAVQGGRSQTQRAHSIHFDEALEQARKAEGKYQNGDPVGALEGLPIAVKEDKGVKGKPTSARSMAFRDNVAGGNALPVERILDAGGIIHAGTNICEMGAVGISGGKLFPPTKNPWNPAFNSGGSSGGAGASLADDLGERIGLLRVNPHPGFGLRCRGIESATRTQSGVGILQFRLVRSRRPDGAHGRRLRPVSERAKRSTPRLSVLTT